jgi:SAM-dependent methyltransferase
LTDWYRNQNFWNDLESFLFPRPLWDRASAEVQQGLTLLQLPRNAHILDIPCGPGRHALEFARRDCAVTAVDLTPLYIEGGQDRALQNDLRIEFLQGDMLSFVRPEAFDAVWNFYSSFGYFKNPRDDQTVVRNFYRSLKKGGKVLIETISREHALRVWDDEERIELPAVDDTTVTVEKEKSGEDSPVMKWCVSRGGKTKTFYMFHRYYSADAISSILAKAGFATVEIFEDIYGTPYTSGSERMVVVGRK